jgi:putative glycosyltransferase (TIGR04372 family)
MSDNPQIFDAPPTLDLEESRRVFSAETFQRLIQLVAPKLQAGKRTLVHIMPASSRFAHMVLEPWALRAQYGEEFDEIVVVIRDRRLLPYGTAPHAVASTVVDFVETTNDLIVKLGHFDAPRMENGPLCVQLRSAPELLKDFWRHVRAGGDPRHLSLPPELNEAGTRFLDQLGVASGDRVVTLHMREGSYLSSHRYHDFRNTTPANYIPAVSQLLTDGAWVFRLGDKASCPLDIDHPRFIDLPTLPGHEDFMDVYLLAKAWFAICCSSGPLGPALAFGTPVLLVNGILEQQTFFNPKDVIQFKRYIDRESRRPIPYQDILERGIAGLSTAKEYEARQVEVEENTPEEILAAVEEMTARLTDGFAPDQAIDQAFRDTTERFLAKLTSQAPERNQTDPSEDYFGLALPWTTISHRYCQANPRFLAGSDSHIAPE